MPINARFMLGVLGTATLILVARAADRSDVPPELVGTWVMREGSGSSYRDTRTGQLSAPNANAFKYTIFPDGRYQHAALLSSSLYQCTMQIFGFETGRVDVLGGVIVFTDHTATLKSTDNCRPQWNYEKPGELGRQRYEWRLARDPLGIKLILLRPGGKQDVFYRQ
jgi:hypothetical protein